MWIIVGPKKDYCLTKFIVNIWSLYWEYQLQINFSIQRLGINGVLGILWWVYFTKCLHAWLYIFYTTFFFFVRMLLILCSLLICLPKLNETNFNVCKEAIEIILDDMDLDLALRTSSEAKIEKWDHFNWTCIVIMKRP